MAWTRAEVLPYSPVKTPIAVAIFLVVVILSGCASRRTTASDGRIEETLTVRIVNRNWADMRVYIERDGLRVVLGLVTSGSTETFAAPREMTGAAATLRLIGDPVGSALVFDSGPFTADRGQTVEWTIRVRPAQSGLSVH